MSFINPNKNKDLLIRHIKNSRVGFNFDKKRVKTRLLENIQDQQISLAQEKIEVLSRKSFIAKHKWAVSLAALLLFLGGAGSGLARVDLSKPGDRLYGIDQWHEEFVLKLPLPQTQKAEFRANIVDERNKELDYLIQVKNHNQVGAQAVIESSRSLETAIEEVRTSVEEFENRGKEHQADQLKQVLYRLDDLAQQQADKVESLRELSDDDELKKTLSERLEMIKKSRSKARLNQSAN